MGSVVAMRHASPARLLRLALDALEQAQALAREAGACARIQDGAGAEARCPVSPVHPLYDSWHAGWQAADRDAVLAAASLQKGLHR